MNRHCVHPSPLGPLLLMGSERGLRAICFEPHAGAPGGDASSPIDERTFDAPRRQLDAYFKGSRRSFELALDPIGTEFQRAVWRALQQIEFGETRSYSQIAAAIQSPRAVRAVGMANGRNPLAIVVPCHRVVGADGSLTGYAGGMERKRWLLQHEQRLTAFALTPT